MRSHGIAARRARRFGTRQEGIVQVTMAVDRRSWSLLRGRFSAPARKTNTQADRISDGMVVARTSNGNASQLISASFLRASSSRTRTTTERMCSRTLSDRKAVSSVSSRERSSAVISCILNLYFFNDPYETARAHKMSVRCNHRLRCRCSHYTRRTDPTHSGALRCVGVRQSGAVEKTFRRGLHLCR